MSAAIPWVPLFPCLLSDYFIFFLLSPQYFFPHPHSQLMPLLPTSLKKTGTIRRDRPQISSSQNLVLLWPAFSVTRRTKPAVLKGQRSREPQIPSSSRAYFSFLYWVLPITYYCAGISSIKQQPNQTNSKNSLWSPSSLQLLTYFSAAFYCKIPRKIYL